MAGLNVVTYAAAKSYTDQTVVGGGALKGKNCTVDSISDITGGHRVTFKWTLDNGTVQTGTMDVMDGADGQDGAPGQDGRDGLTPVITVDEITGGHRITITVGSDTDTIDVMDGVQGPQGPTGPSGQDGVGVPEGGTTGQVLKKKSGSDYDTEWADESGGGSEHGIPAGGTSGQILSKNSNTDYDAKWIDPEAYSQEQANWSQADSSKVDFIKNKPQNLVQDANYVHTDNNYDATAKGIVDGVTAALDGKVDKVTGKGLSTNDYTTEEKTKLASLENYDDTALSGRVSDIEDVVPTDASASNKLATADDIPDVSNFITNTVNNLANYYLKSETYTQAEVDALISAIVTLDIRVVSTLPVSDISRTTIYLVPKSTAQTQNVYDEYINTDGTASGWEKIGDTEIDLSDYVTDSELSAALADYTTTANLTTLLAAKQDTISDLSDIRSGAAAGATAYQKPSTGIPKTDLVSAVQTSLDNADTAYQKPVTGILSSDLADDVLDNWVSGQDKNLYTGDTSVSFTVPDATKAYDPYFETYDGTSIVIINKHSSGTTLTYTIRAVTAAQSNNASSGTSGCKAKLRKIV